MTNLQLYLALGIPALVFLAGAFMNVIALSGLREEVKSVREEVKALREEMRESFRRVDHRLDVIEADLRQFYKVQGEHAIDIARLKDKTGTK